MTPDERPRLLDLFCGAGGATRGYQLAGFQVWGVDVKPQPNCCGDEVFERDALEVLEAGWWRSFDAIHASPPCQAFSRAGKLREAQGGKPSSGDLLTPTLALLRDVEIPWVVENVPNAPLTGMTLCGSMFPELRCERGPLRRHRVFASNVLLTPPRPCSHTERPVGVYHVMGDEIPNGGRTAKTLDEAREAMGVDWMTWPELKEAIPPDYTAHIGAQLLQAVRAVA